MFIILMGVSGSGKTTLGKRLAARLGWPFYDGDDYHPPENVAKMAAGIPLTDEDRVSWLETLAELISQSLARGENGVLACSALKGKYREILRGGSENVEFVFLRGSYDLVLERLKGRTGHFMKADLLSSQFAALEEPADALRLEINRSEDELVNEIIESFFYGPGKHPLHDLLLREDEKQDDGYHADQHPA